MFEVVFQLCFSVLLYLAVVMNRRTGGEVCNESTVVLV